MNEKSLIPSIRFAGFTDAWERRKVEKLAIRVSSIGEQIGRPRVEYEDIISGIGQLNKDIFSKVSNKPGIEFADGDVLYGKLRPYLKNWLLPNFNGLAVGDFWVLRPQNVDSKFLFRLIQSRKFEEVANQSAGTKMPRADWKLVSKTDFGTPLSAAEQRKLGSFFEALDSFITLHQRKYEKLLNIKKSMLDKMFPKNGELFPEVRFAGFTDAWEQCKLGDCFEERDERSSDGELISVTIGEGIKRFSELGRHDNSSEDKSHYKRVEVGDIAYNSMRMWQGASGYSSYSGILSPAYTVLIPKKDISSLFFSYVFKRPSMIHMFQINSQGITSDTWNLKYPALSEIETTLPQMEEQHKIAEFLTYLDHLIILHQRKLEKLQNIKKACLEKMFV